MAIEATGFLTSYVLATPSWRRAGVHVESAPSFDAYDWDGHTSALGTPPLALGELDPEDPERIIARRELDGSQSPGSVGTSVWFEDVHTLPRLLDLGLVVSTQQIAVEVHNAYRRVAQSFTAWTNNAGAGVDLLGETFPTVFGPLEGSGVDLTVEVRTEGDPIVDSTLLFVWGATGTNVVSIRFTRVLPLALGNKLLIPEDEYEEILRFKTRVLGKPTGEEQRAKLRKNPRQEFEHLYRIDEGHERAAFDLKLENLQHRLWAVGIWEHETGLTVAAPAGSTSLQVASIAYADFRVGGTFAVFVEDEFFDIRAIVSLTEFSLEFDNPLDHSYEAGARVVPLAAARLSPIVEAVRYPVNLADVPLRFEIADNDRDLADDSGFSSLNGRVYFDGDNVQTDTNPDGVTRDFIVIDGDVGRVYLESSELFSRRGTLRTFLASDAATRWALRGALHYLAGKLRSFYAPTYRNDLLVSQTLVEDETRIFVHFAGYGANVAAAIHRRRIRIELVDGTVYHRVITGSEVSADGLFETLALDDSWPMTIEPEDVERVSFVLPMRFDTDDVRIRHRRGGTIRVALPAKVVFE